MNTGMVPDRLSLERHEQSASKNEVETPDSHGRGDHKHPRPVNTRQQNSHESRSGGHDLTPARGDRRFVFLVLVVAHRVLRHQAWNCGAGRGGARQTIHRESVEDWKNEKA